MTIFQTIILGIIEGLTEFLPVSSTTHLIVTKELMNIVTTPFIEGFMISIQLGAILAGLVVLYKDLLNISTLKKLIVATIPALLLGSLLYSIIHHILSGNLLVPVIMLVLGGIVLIVIEYKKVGASTSSATDGKPVPEPVEGDETTMTMKQAFFIGLAQCIAFIPGVSRSATTIVTGKLMGIEKQEVVTFSFLLALPTMVAATGYDLYKTNFALFHDAAHTGLFVIGFLTAFVVALITVKFFLDYVRKVSFAWFGYYRILLAVFVIVFLLVK